MLLSIIVPVYNTEKYLKKCIGSLLSQKINDYEIILVDDGSTDKSGEICDEYLHFDNVRVIHQKNSGVIFARQAGLKIAQGKYVCYADSDDFADADFYKNMLDVALKYDCDAVIGSMLYDYKNKCAPCINSVREGLYNKQQLKDEYYGKMLFDKESQLPAVNPSLCNKIFKKSILERVMPCMDKTVTFGEDVMCSYPCMLDCDRIYVLCDEAFYHYVQHSLSMTHFYDVHLLDRFLALSKVLISEFGKRGFDDEGQINAYIARYSLECIRKELLYHKKTGIFERIKIVKRYIKEPVIKEAFLKSVNDFNKKIALKVRLVNKRHIFILYILVKGKSFFLKGGEA